MLTVTDASSSITISGAWNAFSGSPSAAPGSLISIYGANLSADSGAASSVPLPDSLKGTSVTIAGIRAPLLFVSPGQINAQVPFEAPVGTASLLVQAGSIQSAPVKLEITASSPGILTTPGDIHAIAINCGDGTLISAQNPATPGSLTGQGMVNPLVPSGAAAPSDPLSLPLAEVRATVGGKPASIAFAGLAPGFVGVLQINLVIPDIPTGDQPLAITIGGLPANRAAVPIRKE
jgi:uncharacterized protein (TIGR03437 family)